MAVTAAIGLKDGSVDTGLGATERKSRTIGAAAVARGAGAAASIGGVAATFAPNRAGASTFQVATASGAMAMITSARSPRYATQDRPAAERAFISCGSTSVRPAITTDLSAIPT